MAFAYILGSIDGAVIRTYTGWTIDLDQRLLAHNCGRGAKYTRGRSWILLYAERHATERAARKREIELKRERRRYRNYLQRLLADNAVQPCFQPRP